ncbi:transcriptional regulator CynR [Oxalobacteraceae bacterium OM1]|nr:transcriptional regulator CynR [Oxalobacteraceae bacterium OM1]
MQLRQLRYLIAVAEHGNFTRAAEALHVSQPALSQQILQIEDRLGVALLDRSGRSVTVTDAGQVYIAHARRALQELESGRRAIHDVHDLSRGMLRLAMTPTFTAYLAGPLIADFYTRHPGICVGIQEMSMDTIAAAVAADEVDLGIAFQLTHAPEVECLPMFMERLSVVVADDHPWATRGTIAVQEVEQLGLALLSADFETRSNIDDYLQRFQFMPKVAIEANTISALIAIVRHSSLATILPDAICAQVPGLSNLILQPEPPPRTAMLLRRKDSYLSAAGRAFVALFTDNAVRWEIPPGPDMESQGSNPAQVRN